jgi:uncharacterized protein (DUF1810 family)
MSDPFDLDRFVEAQARTYAGALAELRRGRKTGHWIWFVFPQLRGLGHSPMATHYGIASLAQARGYLAHPVLGPRLVECSRALLDVPGSSAVEILGGIDALKVRSSMTLFAAADPDQPVFAEVLRRYYDGVGDPLTLGMLGAARPDDGRADTGLSAAGG